MAVAEWEKWLGVGTLMLGLIMIPNALAGGPEAQFVWALMFGAYPVSVLVRMRRSDVRVTVIEADFEPIQREQVQPAPSRPTKPVVLEVVDRPRELADMPMAEVNAILESNKVSRSQGQTPFQGFAGVEEYLFNTQTTELADACINCGDLGNCPINDARGRLDWWYWCNHYQRREDVGEAIDVGRVD